MSKTMTATDHIAIKAQIEALRDNVHGFSAGAVVATAELAIRAIDELQEDVRCLREKTQSMLQGNSRLAVRAETAEAQIDKLAEALIAIKEQPMTLENARYFARSALSTVRK